MVTAYPRKQAFKEASRSVMDEKKEVGSNDKHCCVPMCTGNGRLHPELSFHRFPTVQERRLRWIQAIRRDPGALFKISSETVVCSRHFKDTDFKWSAVRKTLRPDSTPTVFTWKTSLPPRRELVRVKTTVQSEKISTEKILLTPPTTVKPYHVQVNLPSDSDQCSISRDQQSKIDHLEQQLKERDEELAVMARKLSMERFGVQRFGSDDSMFLFYTGFSSVNLFYAFFNYIKPSADSMTSYYYKVSDKKNPNLVGRQRNMLLVDELFMFLCRLKCGLIEQDLALRFNSHICTVSRKVITWGNLLYFVLGSFQIWPSRERTDANMPYGFETAYPKTRVIIDCTEIKTERPSSLALGSKCYSSYKSSHTWKGLVGIAPHGALTFVSMLYTGSLSDVEITKLCGLLSLLEPGDEIMADKGFVLKKALEGTGVGVVMPPFLNNGRFTTQQVEDTQTIARLRIHVERHIRRVKEFHLFDSIVPLSMVGSINQLWTVANLLTLFRGPLVKQWPCS